MNALADTASPFVAKARLAYRCLIGSYIALLLVLLVSTLSNPPAAAEPGLSMWLTGFGIAVFKSLPLMLFIPGLIARSHKSAAWLAYMILLYFVVSILFLFTPGSGTWGWLMVFACLAIFISAILFTRWQKRVEAGL
ncbi:MULTISPECIES: DUF2069 domain-containing protein [unclassified Oceanobacter]|uniref:DUF2069 domain-containing protein n=1 Tax=unclassified Oceanobacter TaxID=2620260 RepID=UPI0026E12A00|nr:MULTISPECIES: DUF2069 domain-containing protein [unclassified Oceanobacter]MDO6683030.1 DUF2069 domain-containing protein [Oceanobacter sp. 5_MG-2023]MDP2507042.1 DUF2069 domain-containing protein [Oceanobacter sp. 3_MG-2023]MDP2548154.1 DUF2069 domain-containing protein [Oceanobacter sp. 4_MG-2023]MDP2609563.1 DUF2069 domain-containing protein [Oceanobacter sp. 1_MG-2023]MDP2612976.1 DUF2069 domain-containing protein [Oceanobacter sp. 2_MG-2023]